MSQTQKGNNPTASSQAKPQAKKVVAAVEYTVEEFAAAPTSIGAVSADIVRAALTTKCKSSYTIEEAKEIVKKFKDKEVK